MCSGRDFHKMAGKRKSVEIASFQRKKRKVGKDKRLPENATKASFTTGKVVISTQLSLPDEDEVVTKRKQTIPVLLFQLKQHNTVKRRDALDGLREIFTKHADLTLQHLQSLMTNTAHLYTDAEPSVRHSLQLLLKAILSQVDSAKLQPFQQQALACVECGLTHITSAIRVDTLKVVDLYFSLHPSLFQENIFKFLKLHVSILASQSCLQKGRTHADRKKVPLDKPHNPEKLKILNQLLRFLEAVVQSKSSCSNKDDHAAVTPLPTLCVREGRIQTAVYPQITQLPMDTLCQFFTMSSGQPHLMVLDQFGLLPTEDNVWEEQLSCSSVSRSERMSKLGCDGSTSSQESVSKELSLICPKMVPLLLESWIDSVPDTLQSAESITPHAVETMERVAHILVVLLRVALLCQGSLSVSSNSQPIRSCIVKQLWRDHGNQLVKHLLLFFPHSKSIPSLLPWQYCSKPEMLSALLSLDSYICESILTLVATAEGSRMQAQIFRPLFAFISDVLSKMPRTHSASTYSPVITTSLNTLLNLLELVSGPLKIGMDVSLPVLSCALQFYLNTHPQSSARMTLNKAFAKLMEKIRNEGQIDTDNLTFRHLLVPWLMSLPRQLVQLLSSGLLEDCPLLLDIMVAAAPVGIMDFGEALQDSALGMIDGLKGKTLPSNAQSRFVELLLYIPILGAAELRQIATLLWTGSLDGPAARYLLDLVDQRLVGSSMPSSAELTLGQEEAQVLLYLRFMVTVALGYTQAKLQDIRKDVTPDGLDELPAVGSVVVVPTLPSDQAVATSVQAELTSYVCECLGKTSFAHQLFELTADFLCDLVCGEDQVFLPVGAAQGILQLALCFARQSPVPEALARGLAHLILTVLLNAVAGPHSLTAQCGGIVKNCAQQSIELITASLLLASSVLGELKDAMLEMRGGKDPIWGIPAVQVLVTLLDEPRLEGALRQCRPLVASSQYTAELLLHEEAPDNTMKEFEGGTECDQLLAKLELLCRRLLGGL